LRAEGFSCSLGDLYGGIGISKIAIFDQENKKLNFQLQIFSILSHQTLDPESGSAIRKIAGSGSVSGSALN
jgi:hypothetical protein